MKHVWTGLKYTMIGLLCIVTTPIWIIPAVFFAIGYCAVNAWIASPLREEKS